MSFRTASTSIVFIPTTNRSNSGSRRDKINIVFVGRLDPRKGVNHLIAAMPQVVERTRGRARFLIVGDSYLRRKLEAPVRADMREHVDVRRCRTR